MLVLRRALCRHPGTFQGVLDQLSRRVTAPTPDLTHQTIAHSENAVEAEIVESASQLNAQSPQSIHLEPVDRTVIQQEISRTISTLLDTQAIWLNREDNDRAGGSLTPAQIFFEDNRALLEERAIEYGIHRAESEFAQATREIEDEWTFYRHPVIRKPRGYQWDTSNDSHTTDSSQEDSDLSIFDSFSPSLNIENIVRFLSAHKLTDILPIDLEQCNRRDVGEWAVIGTVVSAVHASKAANELRKEVAELKLENIICTINAIPGQDWVVARVGPIVVHLMTAEQRLKYALEDIYSSSNSGLPAEGFAENGIIDEPYQDPHAQIH
jgi:ribosomal silencing factor RsfS